MCCDSGGGGTSQAPAPVDNKFTDTLADIANKQWDRNVSTFQPLEDKAIAETEKFNSPQYAAEQEAAAGSDVTDSFARARATQQAGESGVGVNPNDGAWGANERAMSLGEGAAGAAAVTGARKGAELQGYNALVGMAGKGDAKVNQAIGAANAGGNQYMQSQSNQMGWNENQQQQRNAGWGGVGSLIGTGLSLFNMSSKKLKEEVKPATGSLRKLRALPVNEWQYKKPGPAPIAGVAPMTPGRHLGPMAEDFARATGNGDGRTINHGDALGLTMAAVKQLDQKVSKLQGARK
jgi:hypothetical protein